MTKLIAIDLDGTLLNNESKISEENLAAIKHAQSLGIEIVVATGRAPFDVSKIFSPTGINPWIIGTNGATIHHPEGALFRAVPLDKKDVIAITSWLEQENFYYEIFNEEAIYTPYNGRKQLVAEINQKHSSIQNELQHAMERQFSQHGFSFIHSYQELKSIDSYFYNILAFSFDETKLQKGWNTFKSREDLTLVSSGDYNFELEHPDASKGIALTKLIEHLGIDLRETSAIGDSYNDLSMLKIAGKSAAMGNANEEIKNTCHVVAQTNDENGVAHFINSLI